MYDFTKNTNDAWVEKALDKQLHAHDTTISCDMININISTDTSRGYAVVPQDRLNDAVLRLKAQGFTIGDMTFRNNNSIFAQC